MELSRTTHFRHTLRESSSPIELLCHCTSNGCIMTVDENAIRLWSVRKELKHHYWKPREFKRKFLSLTYIYEYDVCVLMWSNRDEDGKLTSMTAQLWSPELELEQQIAVPYNNVIKVVYSPDYKRILFLTKNISWVLLHVNKEWLPSTKGMKSSIPLFPKQRDLAGPIPPLNSNSLSTFNSSVDTIENNGIGTERKKVHLSFEEYQNNNNSEEANMNKSSFKDLIWQEMDEIIVLVDDYIHWYYKEYVYQAKNTSSKRAQRLAKYGLGPPVESIPKPSEPPFRRLRSANLGNCCPSSSGNPSAFVRIGTDAYIVGFDSGDIHVVLCNLSSADVHENTPRVVCSINAHTNKVLSVFSCPWRTTLGGSVVMEFYSTGDDHRFQHWELIIAPHIDEDGEIVDPNKTHNSYIHHKKFSNGLVSNQIGVHCMVAEPTNTSFWGDTLAKKTRIGMITPFEHLVVGVPRKMVSFGFGGQIVMLEIMAKRLTKTLTKPIVSSALGPLLSDIPQNVSRIGSGIGGRLDTRPGSTYSEGDLDLALSSTFLALSSGVLEFINSIDGEQLLLIDASNKNDDSSVTTDALSIDGLIAKDKARLNALSWLEGRNTYVYWCKHTRLTFIGYSAGGVGVKDFTGAEQGHVKSRKIHSSSITCLLTFTTTDYKSDPDAKETVFLLIGDDSGLLSLWPIEQKGPKTTEATWSSVTHSSKIVGMDSLALASIGLRSKSIAGGTIVVTACRNGQVRAWSVDSQGVMGMIAFFDSNSLVSSLGIIAFRKHKSNSNTMEGSISQLDMPSAITLGNSVSQVSLTEGSVTSNEALKSPSHDDDSGKLGMSVICLVGTTEGHLQSWSLTNKEEASKYPVASGHVHSQKVSSIRTAISSSKPVVNVFSSAIDGSILMSNLEPNGMITRVQYFCLPFPVQNIFIRIPLNEYDSMECIAFGETQISRVLITNMTEKRRLHRHSLKETQSWYKDLPQPDISTFSAYVYSRPNSAAHIGSITIGAPSVENYDGVHDSILHAQQLKEENATDTTVEEIQPHATLTNKKSQNNDDALDLNEVEGDDAEDRVTTNLDIDERLNTLEIPFLEPMDPLQRAVMTELHFTKKDPQLLAYFKQSSNKATNTVTVPSCINIVERWLHMGAHSKEIHDLLRHLEVKDDANLSFLRVAKIAAVMASALGSKYFSNRVENPTRRQRKYRDMVTSKKLVSYNALGEKVIMQRDFSKQTMGLRKGYVDVLRAIWDGTEKKILSVPSIQQYPKTILTVIPPPFKKLIKTNIEFPTQWDPSEMHWFDVRRTIRVARTIMDLRLTEQKKYVSRTKNTVDITTRSNNRQFRDNIISSMPRLVVKYFERNFGGAGLAVAHQKAIHYLEACLQYSEHNILNFMRRCICPDSSDLPLPDVAIWTFAELRGLLISRGCVVNRAPITASTPSADFHAGSADPVHSFTLHWQSVPRAEFLYYTDQILRVKGSYGVHTLNNIMYAVENMRPAIGEGSDYVDMIDFESALEMVSIELCNCTARINSLEQNILWSDTDFLRPTRRIVVKNTESMSLIDCLHRLKDFMLQFLAVDTQRTGSVTPKEFKAVMLHAAPTIIGGIAGPWEVDNIYDACRQLYLDPLDDTICYLDLFSTLLAGIQQTGGDCGFTGSAIAEIINSVKRGVDTGVARSIVEYIAMVQFPVRYEASWVSADHLHRNDTMGAVSFEMSVASGSGVGRVESLQMLGGSTATLPRDGNWSLREPLVPTDDPGMMTVTRVEIQQSRDAAESSLPVDSKAWKKSGEPFYPSEEIVPEVLLTFRKNRNAGGETTGTPAPKFEPQASISSQEITDLAILAPTQKEDISGLGDYRLRLETQEQIMSKQSKNKGSLARALDQYDASVDKDVYFGADSWYEYHEEDYSRIDFSEAPLDYEKPPVSAGELAQLKHSLSEQSVEISARKMKNAMNELSVRHEKFIHDQNSTESLMAMEREIFEKERAFQKAVKKAERKEARKHEKYWMSYKEEQDALRYERLLNARDGMTKKAEAMRLEEEAREAEHKAAMEASRLAELEKARARKQAENEEQERVRELAEMAEMRKMDAFSHQLREYVKEQERLAKEKAEKERLKREAEEAEARRKAIEEEEKRKAEAEKKQRQEDRKREIKELNYMKKEDVDVGKEVEEVAEPEVAETESSLVGEEADTEGIDGLEGEDIIDEEVEGAQDKMKEAHPSGMPDRSTPGKKRVHKNVTKLLDRLEAVEEGNMEDPRRLIEIEGDTVDTDDQLDIEDEFPPIPDVPEGKKLSLLEEREREEAIKDREKAIEKARREREAAIKSAQEQRVAKSKQHFFMPMMFGPDIHFNPFESSEERRKELFEFVQPKPEQEEVGGLPPVDPRDFSDIKKKIERHKQITEKTRRMELYRMSDFDSIKAEDWHEIVIRASADWETYFKIMRDSMQKQETPPPTARSDGEAEFNQTMSRLVEERSMTIKGSVDRLPDFMESLLPESDAVLIHPLPFGKVMQQIVAPEGYTYFQIRLSDQEALITMELSVTKGDCDMYVLEGSSGQLPSVSHYQWKAMTSAANNKKTRILINHFKPRTRSILEQPFEEEHIYLVAVHSASSGAYFDLWAMATQDAPTSSALQRTTHFIRGLNMLSNRSHRELADNFVALHKQSQEFALKEMTKGRTEARELTTELGLDFADEESLRKSLEGSELESPERKKEREKKLQIEREKAEEDERKAMELFAVGASNGNFTHDGGPSTHSVHSERNNDKKKKPEEGGVNVVKEDDKKDNESTFYEESDSDDEAQTMEAFVVRAGRIEMKKELLELSQELGDSVIEDEEDRHDPNMHEELFLDAPVLARSESIDRVTAAGGSLFDNGDGFGGSLDLTQDSFTEVMMDTEQLFHYTDMEMRMWTGKNQQKTLLEKAREEKDRELRREAQLLASKLPKVDDPTGDRLGWLRSGATTLSSNRNNKKKNRKKQMQVSASLPEIPKATAISTPGNNVATNGSGSNGSSSMLKPGKNAKGIVAYNVTRTPALSKMEVSTIRKKMMKEKQMYDF